MKINANRAGPRPRPSPSLLGPGCTPKSVISGPTPPLDKFYKPCWIHCKNPRSRRRAAKINQQVLTDFCAATKLGRALAAYKSHDLHKAREPREALPRPGGPREALGGPPRGPGKPPGLKQIINPGQSSATKRYDSGRACGRAAS
jgi:hypothetical protein